MMGDSFIRQDVQIEQKKHKSLDANPKNETRRFLLLQTMKSMDNSESYKSCKQVPIVISFR